MKISRVQRSVLVLCPILLLAGMVSAADMTFVGQGGQASETMHTAIIAPFVKETGINVREDAYSGEVGPLKAQAESGNVSWDVVSATSSETDSLCAEGLLVQLDYSKIADKTSFFGPGAHECGTATLLYGTLVAYGGDKVKQPVKNWKEFWDVKNFPGARAMRNYVTGNLEFALLADGVASANVYKVLGTPEGVDRAFKKLDEIKPYVKVWWTIGAQPPQLLADGEVKYMTGYSNRFLAANKTNGRNFGLVWDGAMDDYEYWVIVKGTEHEDEATKLLAFASKPEVQAAFASIGLVGPAVKGASEHIDPPIAKDLPTAHVDLNFALDTKFWSDHLEELNARFVTWQSN